MRTWTTRAFQEQSLERLSDKINYFAQEWTHVTVTLNTIVLHGDFYYTAIVVFAREEAV